MANTSFKAENGLSVTGNAEFDYTSKFNANVTIAADQWYIGGNLYVTGQQVFIGGNVAVADIIAGASGLKLGNSTYQWDGYLSNVYVYGTLLNPVGNTVQLGNSTNRWVISGNTLNISTTSTLTGAATLANTIAVTGTATFANTSSHTGAATFANTLGVTGAATLSNTMSVTGAANVLNTFGIGGAANALSTFGVNGVTTLASTLSVTGAATLSNNITVAGNAVFSNAISVANAATFSNTLSVTGAATFANTTGHTGAATFSNTISVTGTSTLTGNATLSGTLQTISGNANFNGGTLFVDAGSGRVGIGTSTPDSVLTVGGPTKVNSTFTVTGTSSFANSVTFANTTTFNQDVTINANLTVTGTRTYVNTQTLDVGDNIITLNADLPGATAPTENAGIEINRGSSANSRLQWTEGTGWQLSSASVSTFYNIVNEGTSNTNLDSGTLFVDAVNNRVGINNTAPGVALRVTGAVDISSTANVQGNANVSGLLGVAGGLAVTGTTNTSAQFNVGGGVATTNGATITNTSILLGNSFVNTQISPSQILIRTNATGNAYSLLSLASSDQVGGSLTLQHGNTTSNSTIVLGAQSGNNATIELGGSSAAFIDFKTPSEDDFDTRLISNTSGFNIVAGSSTSANVLNVINANVNIDAGTLFVDAVNARVGINNTAPGVALRVTGAVDISSTANVQGNANVGGTLGVVSLLTASGGLAVTGTSNVSSNLNVGTFGTTNGISIQNTAIVVGNTTSNALISGNLVSVSNTANLTSTTLTIGATTVNNSQVNVALHTSGLFGVTNGSTINATFMVIGNTTSNAIVSGNLISVSNTANLTSTTLTIGTTTVNSSLVNAAAINVVNQTNTGTLYVSTTANIAGLLNAAAGFVVTGTANIIGGGGATAVARFATGAFPASGVNIIPNATAGTLNSLVAQGDILLNFSSGGTGSGNLVIANWATNTGGIKINGLINDIALVGNSFTFTTGNSNFDSGTLFVDALNNRIGINNTAPGVALRVTGDVDISSTANIQSNANVGGTLGVASLLTASALNVTNQTNTATLFVTTSANVGTAFTANSTLTNAIALNVVNQTNTATLYVTTSANVGTAAVINATGVYTTGVANAFTLTSGATFTANSTLVNAAAINVVNQTNTATLFVTTSANVGTALTISATALTVAPNTNIGGGDLFVDTVNARVGINNTAPGVALRVTGAVDISSTANVQGNANVGGTLGVASLLTASALNVTNQTNTATLFVTTSANVGTALTVNATNINAAANLNMGAYTERLTDLTISAAGTTLLNLQSSSIFRVNVSALTTGVANIRFINPPATGIGVSATLIIQYNTTPVGTFALQGGTSVSNAGSAVKYAYDSAPTLTAATGKSDILSAITYDGGATYIVAPSFMNFTT